MLLTPLGKIKILYDNEEIEYKALAIEYDKSCTELDGRYLIRVSFKPDGHRHIISCRIINYTPNTNDDIESGENLELKSFYKEKVKLSIGMEGDTGYFLNGMRLSEYYDYDTEYLHDGVGYVVLETTTTDEYKFGIAWLNNCTEENDVQTWFGADPTLIV
ncbi:MAG: hypothetical protein Q4F05_08265 [bacterium]|nr:hypothetical protein [bacterium]